MAKDIYYDRSECSNSDLSDLNKLLNPEIFTYDYNEALRFGNLLDAMITEAEKVNVYKRSLDGEIYLQSDFDKAKEMKMAFFRDATCAAFFKLASCQHVSVGKVSYTWNNFAFELDCRARWDLFMKALKMGADIKTTTATTQRQFEDACEHFMYYRSRTWYMNLEKTDQDMLIGISKVNNKIFKVPICRGDKYFEKGQQQAAELAMNYWLYFDGFLTNKLTII